MTAFEEGWFRDKVREQADEIKRLQRLLEMSYPDHMAEIERLHSTLRYIADNGHILGGAYCKHLAMHELEND